MEKSSVQIEYLCTFFLLLKICCNCMFLDLPTFTFKQNKNTHMHIIQLSSFISYYNIYQHYCTVHCAVCIQWVLLFIIILQNEKVCVVFLISEEIIKNFAKFNLLRPSLFRFYLVFCNTTYILNFWLVLY